MWTNIPLCIVMLHEKKEIMYKLRIGNTKIISVF